MKKILTFVMGLFSLAAMAQQPVITFQKTEHDFGKINEADGRVTTVFEFKNEGMEPLILSNVRASCGCTTPKWTKEPVEPGQTGQITVTYNPNGRPGRFQKTITVTSNASEATKKLFIKGEVIPKPAKPVNEYVVKMGELSLKAKSVDFGNVKKGETISREIEYANKTDHELTVALATTSEEDAFLGTQATLETIKPNESGKFVFVLNSSKENLYGPMAFDVYVQVGAKFVQSDEYKINLKANVVEDFSKLTVEQMQQAPILELSQKEVNLGTIKAGKKVKAAFGLKNNGVNHMMVRRVFCDDKALHVVAPKAVKNGKKGEVKVELNTVGMEKGNYSREIVVITNDPKQPVVSVKAVWTVE